MGASGGDHQLRQPGRLATLESADAARRDRHPVNLPGAPQQPRFAHEVLSPVGNRLSLLVVDEAHCISDWGHDFRPHYRLIQRVLEVLPPNLRVLATTATANNRVTADLETVLGPELTVSRGDLNRPSLKLQTIRLPSQVERLAWLAEHLPRLPVTESSTRSPYTMPSGSPPGCGPAASPSRPTRRDRRAAGRARARRCSRIA
jgi:hypothetical protein